MSNKLQENISSQVHFVINITGINIWGTSDPSISNNVGQDLTCKEDHVMGFCHFHRWRWFLFLTLKYMVKVYGQRHVFSQSVNLLVVETQQEAAKFCIIEVTMLSVEEAYDLSPLRDPQN